MGSKQSEQREREVAVALQWIGAEDTPVCGKRCARGGRRDFLKRRSQSNGVVNRTEQNRAAGSSLGVARCGPRRQGTGKTEEKAAAGGWLRI